MENCKRILVVDDELLNRDMLTDTLEALGYETRVATNGPDGLACMGPDIDLALLDVMMPGMSAFDLCRAIREDQVCGDLPIVMVTALSGKDDRIKAVEAGANDFLTKPIDRSELRVRVASLLKLKEAQDAAKLHRAELEASVQNRTADLQTALMVLASAHRKTQAAYLETIQRLAIAAEYRDNDTAEHIHRVSQYCEIIARALGIPDEEVAVIKQASAMHDVGKIGIPDSILLKSGLLSNEERKTMEQHTLIGADILSRSESPVLKAGEVIALSHHEKWDGSGYPYGLRGEIIPVYGRICAVADVFDALTSTRPYKNAFSCDEACTYLLDGRGTHFDPRILDLFFDNMAKVMEVQAQFGEPASDTYSQRAA